MLHVADCGFDIAESEGMTQAYIASHSCIHQRKSQLTAIAIDETRTIAIMKIHVERVFENVRQKYSILQSRLPIDFVAKRVGEECQLIDRIVYICCGLSNVVIQLFRLSKYGNSCFSSNFVSIKKYGSTCTSCLRITQVLKWPSICKV